MVRRELVVARCDPPTLLDLAEEPLDQIARTIEVAADADQLRPINPQRSIEANANSPISLPLLEQQQPSQDFGPQRP